MEGREVLGRKRIRSDESHLSGLSGLQSKTFVNERLVNQSDEKAMKIVYQKTLSMMFAGAKMRQEKPEISADTSIIDTIDDKLPESQGCQICWKDLESSTSGACKNCNLKICRSCQTSCTTCQTLLCHNCVQIFGCSIDDNPICEDCKFYLN